MLVIGIDPGQDGAIAFLADGKVISIIDMPTFDTSHDRREVDGGRLHLLLHAPEHVDLIVIEEVHGSPTFGGAPAFAFGRSTGKALCCAEILGWPMLRIKPFAWKAAILKGTDKSKEAAINYVRQRYPEAELVKPGCRTPSHDRAEAVCLAAYGEAQLRGV